MTKKYLGFALIFMGNVRVKFGAYSEGVLAIGR
jgi:hypothetical protein